MTALREEKQRAAGQQARGLRPAAVEDADEMARLSTELGYAVPAAEMRLRLSTLLADPRHRIVVADGAPGGLLGWVHAEQRFSLRGGDQAEIMGLIVDASTRRAGIGAALVAAAEQWAMSRAIPVINVRSNAAREQSHPFYEAQGYERVKTQHAYTKRLR